MKKHTLTVLELVLVLLATVLIFRLGIVYAQTERGYNACGGEHLILTLPVLYYIGKQILQDWITDIRKIRMGGKHWRKGD